MQRVRPWLAEALEGDVARLCGELIAYNWEEWGWHVGRLGATDAAVGLLRRLQLRHPLHLRNPEETGKGWHCFTDAAPGKNSCKT